MWLGRRVSSVWVHVRVSETIDVGWRLDADLNIGPAPHTMPSRFLNDNYPRKEIKALSTIELKWFRNGLRAGRVLILDDLCCWSTVRMSVLSLKQCKANVSSERTVSWTWPHFCHVSRRSDTQQIACTVTGPPDFGVGKETERANRIETEMECLFYLTGASRSTRKRRPKGEVRHYFVS